MGDYRHELDSFTEACGLVETRARYLMELSQRLDKETQNHSSLVEAFEKELSLSLREKLIGIFLCGKHQGGMEVFSKIMRAGEHFRKREEDEGEAWKHADDGDDGDEWKKIVSGRHRF